MEVVYRLCSEDVLSFVSNKENDAEVMRQVQESFSCMEELKVFVEVVENAINCEKGEKPSLIRVEANQLNLVEDYPEDVYRLPSRFTVLALETDNHLFHLYVEENSRGKLLSYDFHKKDYYTQDKYTLTNIVSEALENQIDRDSFYEYSLGYFIRLFVKYLTNGNEYLELAYDDESIVLVKRDTLENYLEDEDDTNPDFPNNIKDFMKEYDYGDVHEFLNVLSRRGDSYFLYRV